MNRWLQTRPGERLDELFFREYRTQSTESQERARIKHGFTRLVDRVSALGDFAFKTTLQNDITERCTFVAHCENRIEGLRYEGYATDERGLCYHRCISTETKNPNLIGLEDALNKAVQVKLQCLPDMVERKRYKSGDILSMDEDRKVIKIHDGKNDLDIYLFSKSYLNFNKLSHMAHS
ncbi:MAG: hypothetical protein ACI9S8_001795 [Chlamydiales bacterium]